MAAHPTLVTHKLTKQRVATEQEKGDLISAIQKGDITSVTKLIKTQSDLLNSALDAYGNAALYFAIEARKTDIITLLVENGAPVNATYKDGETPLHIAIQYGNMKAIALFVDKGAEINTPTKYGGTPLYFAIQFRNIQAISLLLQNNADINMPDRNGETPSELAAHLPEIATLIENHKKARLMWQFWEMETPIYNSHSQWLPRELLEDVNALITTPASKK